MRSFGYKSILTITCLALALSLVGCNSRTTIAKDFMSTIFAGKARDALKLLCVDGGVDAIVAIHADWSDEIYKELYKDDDMSQVRVSGRLIFSGEDLQRYFPMVREVLLQKGYQVPDLPESAKIGAGLQFGVDFDGFYLQHDDLRNKWCVEGDTYYSFLQYLYQMVIEELAKIPQ